MIRDLFDPECTIEVEDGHLMSSSNRLQSALVAVDHYRAEFLELAITDSRDNHTNAIILDRESATLVLQALVGYLSNG